MPTLILRLFKQVGPDPNPEEDILVSEQPEWIDKASYFFEFKIDPEIFEPGLTHYLYVLSSDQAGNCNVSETISIYVAGKPPSGEEPPPSGGEEQPP